MSPITYLLTFTEGILTFISPCILPMLPVYFIYLAGQSSRQGEYAASTGRSRLVLNSVGFVAGFTLVFVSLGAAAAALGSLLTANRGLLEKLSGAVMIAFGLNFTGLLKLRFLNMGRQINYSVDKLSFLNSLIFGIVFGLGWTPCLGAFLGSALALAGNSRTVLQGMLLLFIYSIGLGIPFILSSAAADRFKESFKLIQKRSRAISIISGSLLILVGLLVFTGNLKYLTFGM